MDQSLEPISPEDAVELYLAEKAVEVATATLYSHTSRLGHFVKWCTIHQVANLNTLTGRRLHEYRLWRRNDGNLAPASEKTQMDTIRVFIRWCESIDAVPQDLAVKVLSPSLSPAENARDVMLDAKVAKKILNHLTRYEYASPRHIVFTLIWRGLLLRGAVRAIDVSDYNPEDQSLQVKHRPETGTPIKNKKRGERYIALAPETCALLDDWLAVTHPNVQDEYDRDPPTGDEIRPNPSNYNPELRLLRHAPMFHQRRLPTLSRTTLL